MSSYLEIGVTWARAPTPSSPPTPGTTVVDETGPSHRCCSQGGNRRAALTPTCRDELADRGCAGAVGLQPRPRDPVLYQWGQGGLRRQTDPGRQRLHRAGQRDD